MKKLSPISFLWLAALVLVLAGCNRQTALVPPEIHYGLETCADCQMIINDPHYAAALAWQAASNAPAQIAKFDDIGCLLAWCNHHPKVQVAAMWVKNVQTAAWLEATSAIYLKNQRLQTPMGWGIVAGAAKSDFPELVERDPVLTWTELLKRGESQAGSTIPENIEPTKH